MSTQIAIKISELFAINAEATRIERERCIAIAEQWDRDSGMTRMVGAEIAELIREEE